ncbi:MAG: hypothetical protein RMJ44_07605 [Cytophagales bacterium]|nr:hypothetical protein [Bernardetiaceae bacterium]MDW8210940.1 hypothetical protein [Cytophagales bacterium]
MSANEFVRLSLTRQCSILGKDGYLLGIRRNKAKQNIWLYLLYDFLVEVYFEPNGLVSNTLLPEATSLSLYVNLKA